MKYYSQVPINYSDINSFYKNLNNANFRGIDTKKLLELKFLSKEFNAYFYNPNVTSPAYNRYTTIMNRIKTNAKLTSDAERYILFMFSVDPNFEAAIIYASENHKKEIKKKMEERFGVFDPNLISIEKFYIKNFLSEKKRNEVKEEITKRIFK